MREIKFRAWDKYQCNDDRRPDFVERKIIGNIYENPELLRKEQNK